MNPLPSGEFNPYPVAKHPGPDELSIASVDDVIVLEAPGAISADQVQRIMKRFGEVMPGRKVVVLGDGLKVRVIRS